MYTLYIANKNYSSWSLRPWVLMRTLEIPFEERLVLFVDGPNWERFRKFSPNGRRSPRRRIRSRCPRKARARSCSTT